jgi:hypothetical protein
MHDDSPPSAKIEAGASESHLEEIVLDNGPITLRGELDALVDRQVLAHHVRVVVHRLWPAAASQHALYCRVGQIGNAVALACDRKLGAAPSTVLIWPIIDHTPHIATGKALQPIELRQDDHLAALV